MNSNESVDWTNELSAAQLEKLRLEIESLKDQKSRDNESASALLQKLHLELQSLRSQNTWWYRIIQSLTIVTPIVAVAGFWFGVVQFKDQHVEQNVAREKEFKKVFWEKQLQLYVEVPQEIVKCATKLVSEFSFGNRGIADGSREQQITGLIGQIVLADLFQLARPDGFGGPDGGVDFEYAGHTIDVKTMGRNVHPQPHHVNNFMGLQKHFATDLLLFCSLNKRSSILTVCGWIEKGEFLRRATLYSAGSLRTRSDGSTFRTKADLYEIQNQDLRRPKSPSALKVDLSRLG